MVWVYVCFVNDTATTEIYTYRHTLSLQDALPISGVPGEVGDGQAECRQQPRAHPVGARPPDHRPAHVEAERSGLVPLDRADEALVRSEEHTSELQSLMRISYAVFCLKKKKHK